MVGLHRHLAQIAATWSSVPVAHRECLKMQPTTGPTRRPINEAALEPYIARRKPRSAKVLCAQEQSITLSRDEFVPIIQAEVGSDVPVNVYSYKVLVPIAQVVRESG